MADKSFVYTNLTINFDIRSYALILIVTNMKKLRLSTLFCLLSISMTAQINPPKQTDTLIITSVKYNYADIKKENWPCDVIYKSTTSFRIGDEEFPILSANKFGDEVSFYVTDKEGKDEYELIFVEYSSSVVVKFSGYEFYCNSKDFEQFNYEAFIQLEGRHTVGNVPTVSSSAPGIVIVDIWVDNYGNVVKAVPGGEGSTIDNKELVSSVRATAMKTHFNVSSDAPAIQKGVITYRSNDNIGNEKTVDFQLVEVKPTFRGKDANAFSEWVHSKLNYPKELKKADVRGAVLLSFTVAKDGSVIDVKVLRGINERLDDEAIRVVSSSPKWVPGKSNEQPIAVTYTMPVIFH